MDKHRYMARKPTDREQAQELAWQAMDLMDGDEEQAAKLCRQALDIYPDCVDALAMLADIESKWERDFVSGVKKAIEAGRRDLGEKFFRQNKGYFWGLTETRPFMRAMGALGETLASNEYHQDDAIAVYEEMLDLNPNDNQGVRYGLLGCLLPGQKAIRCRADSAGSLSRRSLGILPLGQCAAVFRHRR